MQSTSVDELKKQLAENDSKCVLIDVREPFEFMSGHIKEAKNIPLQTLPADLENLRGIETVFVQCFSGGRSAQACQYLRDSGINAINVEGGMSAWERAGYPVV